MRHKGVRKKFLSRVLGLFLAVTILCSAFIFGENAGDTAVAAQGIAPLAADIEEYTIVGRVADPITDARNNNRDQMGFSDIPLVHDGRIWTDKTVVVGDGDDDFDVTFSALSQSFTIQMGYAIPSDIVIIIDVSGSMAQYNVQGGASGTSRIAYLVDALNVAIDILMNANPENRVAVVAYGGRLNGWARVEHVLRLGRYTPAVEGPNAGTYFSVATRTTLPSGTANTMRIHAVPGTGGAVVPTTNSIQVLGSTPTQWGIYEGAKILHNRDANDIVVEVPRTLDGEPDDTVLVTRRPNIILMTDGEPTMGWSNWMFDYDGTYVRNPVTPGATGSLLGYAQETGDFRFYGDGSFGEMGLAIFNVLTAAHRKRMVFDNYFYYWNDNDPPYEQAQQPAPFVGFYNISLGQAGRDIIEAMMDPFAGSPSNWLNYILPNNIDRGDLTTGSNPETGHPPSMQDRLLSFVNYPAQPIQFHALYRQAFNDYRWATPGDLNNTDISRVEIQNFQTNPLTFADIDYPTEFYLVGDAARLEEVFKEIAMSIQSTATTEASTEDHGDPQYDGWLVFTDVLGEYMEFRDIGNLVFPANTLNADAIEVSGRRINLNDMQTNGALSTFIETLQEHLNYGTDEHDPLYLQLPAVNDLVTASMTQYNDRIVYFADNNRNFVENFSDTPIRNPHARVEIFPMEGTVFSPLGDVDEQRNLWRIAFHVVTVLRPENFTEIRNIPGAGTTRALAAGDQLIRWYIPGELIPMRRVNIPDAGQDAVPIGNLDPVRVTFTVGLDEDRVLESVTAAYRRTNAAPEGGIHFYTNRWRVPNNVTFAFFEPHEENPFYDNVPIGWRGLALKTDNRTETAEHVSRLGAFGVADQTDLHWLGNNGRLTLVENGVLRIKKEFFTDWVSGYPGNTAPTDIVFTIIGPPPANIEIQVNYSEFSNGNFHLEGLPPGTYTITKTGGSVSDYIYLPQPGATIVTISSSQTTTVRFINEYFTESVHPPALRVRKHFHGIPQANYPPNFQITITANTAYQPNNPNDNQPEIEWVEVGTNQWRTTLNLTQSLRGVHLQNLLPGTYTITEHNYPAAGFTGPDMHWIWHDGVAQPTPGTGNTFNVNISDTPNPSDIVASFHNHYTRVTPPPVTPPTGPPSVVLPAIPPTGDDAQMGVYVAIMVLSLLFIAGTVVVFVRFRRKGN